jgi:hypothetical protein
LVALSFISWQFGLAAMGVALTGGAIAFLARPTIRQRMTVAVAAARENAWVSPPIEAGGVRGLLMIDEEGIGVIEGTTLTRPIIHLPWSEIRDVGFEGPVTRPTEMRIAGMRTLEVSGRLPSAVFDELARHGATIPDPS